MLEENIKKFLPFLEELRHKLFTSAIIFAVTFFVGVFLTGPILKILTTKYSIEKVVIATTSPFQITDLAVNLGIFFGLVITIPIVIFQIYSFIFPGLTKKEKKILITSVPICIFLFFIGFSFGASVLFVAFNFLANLNTKLGIQNIWTINSYFSEIFLTSSLMGLLFQFPLILTGLMKLKMLSVVALKNKRRLAWFISFIIVSLLPPTDGLSLIIMATPIILLYEITIFINRKHRF